LGDKAKNILIDKITPLVNKENIDKNEQNIEEFIKT